MATAPPTCGIALSRNDPIFTNEKEGDVRMYAGSSNQNIYIGHIDRSTASMTVNSNMDVLFGRDTVSANVNATSALVLHMGGVSAVEANISVEGTIGRYAASASNHTFLTAQVSGVASWDDISAVGDYTVTYGASNSTFTSDVAVNGGLSVAGNAVFNSNLTIIGSLNTTTINYDHSNVTVYNSETINSNLTVMGYTAVDDLYTNGPATFSNVVNTSNLNVQTGFMTIGSNANTTYPLYVQSASSVETGSISIMANGDISALSDRRYKTDIVTIPSALEKIGMVSGYTFSWLSDAAPSGYRSAGVMAQDIANVLPEVVSTDAITGKMHVAYGNISALLIQGIKELKYQTHALVLTSVVDGEVFDVALPPRAMLIGDSSAAPWKGAMLSASSESADLLGAYASVSTDGCRVQGRLGKAGMYSILAFC